ncbi:RNA polymerase sigma factor [Flavobacterium sp.]|uniref:RNA polymerase sigma factor n=1 Tax=Flavobacterium sp. TaxID=239 RepID=UPI003D0A5E45
MMHEDYRYIKGLATNDSAIINAIYKNFVPKVIYYIKNNSGDEDQAQDVVQEVLISLYHMAQKPDFELTCPFDAFFFLLCKRKWLNELKKNTRTGVTNTEEFVFKDENLLEMVEQATLFDQKRQLFDEMFQQLGEKCREVLQLSFSIPSMEKVAEMLNVSYAYVRKKKSLCTGQLTEMIQQSAKYKLLKS